MAATFPTVTLIVNLSGVAVLWIGADRVAGGSTEIGSLIAFLTYMMQILSAVMLATFMLSMIPRAGVAAARIGEVLDTRDLGPPAAPGPSAASARPARSSSAAPRSATRAHSTRCSTTCRSTSRRAKRQAIIGSTGAGKTTLLQLAARLMDTTDGNVLVGGVDVRDLDTRVLWGSLGYVPQKSYLFGGPSRRTSASADPRPPTTSCGTRSRSPRRRFRAGPRRRARQPRHAERQQPVRRSTSAAGDRPGAGRPQPRVYLFDDSFSALDLATEARLRAALEPRTRDAAVLVVAQRVSTIELADQILVLEDGQSSARTARRLSSRPVRLRRDRGVAASGGLAA